MQGHEAFRCYAHVDEKQKYSFFSLNYLFFIDKHDNHADTCYPTRYDWESVSLGLRSIVRAYIVILLGNTTKVTWQTAWI